ncbi:MAG: hypothetical protein EU981_04195 [Candidatus Liberibacter ctenarytainae]|uniref:Alkaline proteinase inhibitor/ Outer membrane lipoprotein Omp19 domain-containing protein n=1 Tax=Candidatus Liberibacter ctenarytainae TaxID=2020335 RepID=A0A937AM34_9HYPH|nr:hypothetical protein [Candidatus Liberibacter ctenarytainae]
MQLYRFIILYFCILSSYGCNTSHFIHIFSKKSPDSEGIPSHSYIVSESLDPLISEDENSAQDDDSDLIRSPDIATIRRGMIGAWKVSYQGVDCNMNLTLTRWKKNFRGNARGCYGRLALLSAWDIVDGNLELKNARGNTMIILSKVSEENFQGNFDKEKSQVSVSR